MTLPQSNGAPDPARPAYLIAQDPAQRDAAQTVHAQHRLREAVNARLAAVLADAVAEVGAVVAPTVDQGEIRDPAIAAGLTVDLPGAGRIDLGLAGVIIKPSTPPGWQNAPKFGRGQVIDRRGLGAIVVLGTLGDRTDPRPGYRVAPIFRRPDQAWDVSNLGAPTTVAAAAIEGVTPNERDIVDVPAGLQ